MAKATLTFGVDLSDFNTAIKKISTQTNEISNSLSRGINDALSAYKNGLNSLKFSTNLQDKTKIKADLEELHKKIKASTQAKLKLDINDATNKIKSLAGSIAATIGTLKILQTPITSAINFENSMADVKKVVDFDSVDEIKSFSKEIIKLSRQIPMSANELTQITASGGQLGIAKNNLLEFTQIAAKMGVAFDISAQSAGDSMGKLMNIFNTDTKGISKLGDAINHLSDNSAAKASEVVEVLKRIGGASQTLNLTSQQAAALSAAFLSLGKTPELAATSAKTLLMKLKNISELKDKTKKSLLEIGINADKFQKYINKDPQNAITSFLEAVKNMPQKDKQLSLLTSVFGVGFSADIALLVNGLDTYKKTLFNVSDETKYLNSMTKEFQNKSNTTANNLQLLKNSFTEIAINIGNIFLPAINKIVSVIKNISFEISNFTTKYPNLAKFLTGIIAGIVALNVAFLSLKMASPLTIIALSGFKATLLKLSLGLNLASFSLANFGLTLSAFKLKSILALAFIKKSFFAFSVGLISALKSISLAFLTNPIGLFALAFAGAAFVIYKNWDKVKAFFSGFFEGLKPGITLLKNAFKPLYPVFEMIGNFLTSLFSQNESTKQSLSGWQKVGEIIGGVFSFIAAMISVVIEAISGLISLLFYLPELFSEAFKNIKSFLSPIGNFFNAIKNFFSGKSVDLNASLNSPLNSSNLATNTNQNLPALNTNGDINKLVNNHTQNTNKSQNLQDNKIINISMYNTSATPENVAEVIKKNSYNFSD